jgi:hypothetical protein
MIRARDLVLSCAVSLAATACVGTTGSDLVTFDAAAAGPADATEGQSYAFTSGRGYQVTLTCARLHVGAVYLNRSLPTSGAQSTDCILPGFYVAQVTEGLDVDVLSPTPQPFPGKGEATGDPAKVGEVWLTYGDVNAPDEQGIILDLAGTAERDGVSYPFQGQLTIGQNRAVPVGDPSMPSANPICKQRIVSPILDDQPAESAGVDITPRDGGRLLLRVQPSNWFGNVNFSQLDQAPRLIGGACGGSQADPPRFTFANEPADPASNSLYNNGFRLHSSVYYFSWNDAQNP